MTKAIKKFSLGVIERSIALLSNITQENLALRILERNLHAKNSVEGYKLRKRLQTRFLKSYPLLHSHEAQRIYGFFHLLSQLKDVEGDLVECGVGRGRFFSIFVFANQYFNLDRTIYGFDSFEGFPVANEKDIGTRVQKIEKISGWDNVQPEMVQYVIDSDADGEGSISLLKDQKPKLKIIKGFFNDTLIGNLPNKISFLHLDADLYISTKDPLKQCLPRMNSGGIIIFDELHEEVKWPGVKQAVEEECIPLGLQPKWFPEVQRFGIQIP